MILLPPQSVHHPPANTTMLGIRFQHMNVGGTQTISTPSSLYLVFLNWSNFCLFETRQGSFPWRLESIT